MHSQHGFYTHTHTHVDEWIRTCCSHNFLPEKRQTATPHATWKVLLLSSSLRVFRDDTWGRQEHGTITVAAKKPNFYTTALFITDYCKTPQKKPLDVGVHECCTSLAHPTQTHSILWSPHPSVFVSPCVCLVWRWAESGTWAAAPSCSSGSAPKPRLCWRTVRAEKRQEDKTKPPSVRRAVDGRGKLIKTLTSEAFFLFRSE